MSPTCLACMFRGSFGAAALQALASMWNVLTSWPLGKQMETTRNLADVGTSRARATFQSRRACLRVPPDYKMFRNLGQLRTQGQGHRRGLSTQMGRHMRGYQARTPGDSLQNAEGQHRQAFPMLSRSTRRLGLQPPHKHEPHLHVFILQPKNLPVDVSMSPRPSQLLDGNRHRAATGMLLLCKPGSTI